MTETNEPSSIYQLPTAYANNKANASVQAHIIQDFELDSYRTHHWHYISANRANDCSTCGVPEQNYIVKKIGLDDSTNSGKSEESAGCNDDLTAYIGSLEYPVANCPMWTG